MAYFTYILVNARGRFYVGHTFDTAKRLLEHNQPLSEGVTFPRRNGPWRLVWSEPHATRATAMAREKQIKRMKSSRWIREHVLADQGGC